MKVMMLYKVSDLLIVIIEYIGSINERNECTKFETYQVSRTDSSTLSVSSAESEEVLTKDSDPKDEYASIISNTDL